MGEPSKTVRIPVLESATGNYYGRSLFAPSVSFMNISLAEATPGNESKWQRFKDYLPIIGRTEGEKRDTGDRLDPIDRLAARATLPIFASILNELSSTKYNKAIDLLKHYVYGRGEDYRLDVPTDWQQAIVSRYKKPGSYKDVSPYNWGLKDMQNSLGHFDLRISRNEDGSLTYYLTDKYKFQVPTSEMTRHGFQIPGLSEGKAKYIQNQLPKGEYTARSGFREKWELKKIKDEWTLLIPHQFLDDIGVNFKISSNFTVPATHKPDEKSLNRPLPQKWPKVLKQE